MRINGLNKSDSEILAAVLDCIPVETDDNGIEFLKKDTAGTVSYTHLTLPTNSLV